MEMAQWVKALAVKSGNLSLSSGTHMDGRTGSHMLSSKDMHMPPLNKWVNHSCFKKNQNEGVD